MKPTPSKKLLYAACAALLLLNACVNDKSKTESAKDTLVNQANAAAKSPYLTVNTWLDDFKNFRTAVYQKDLQKMKTYFTFPVNADTTQIWAAVYNNINESKRPETPPGTFTEADLDKYHSMLFDDAFTKSLLKVKSEVLFKSGEYTTPAIKQGEQDYHMMAQYDKASTTLQLSVMYAGGTDENGEQVSEGEYAVIYFFKVEDNKYLKFDKILFAG